MLGFGSVEFECRNCGTKKKVKAYPASLVCCKLPMAPSKAWQALSGVANFNFSKGIESQAAANAYLAILWATLNQFSHRLSVRAIFSSEAWLPRHRFTEFDETGNSEALEGMEPELWKELSISGAKGKGAGRIDVMSPQAISFFRTMGAAVGWEGLDSDVELFVIADVAIPVGLGLPDDLDINSFDQMLEFLQSASRENMVPVEITEWLLENAASIGLADKLSSSRDFLVNYEISGTFSDFDEYSEELLDNYQYALENDEFTSYRPSLICDWKKPNPFSCIEAQSHHTSFLLDWDPDSEEALAGDDIEVNLSEEVVVEGSVLVKATSSQDALRIASELFLKVHQIERVELLLGAEDREGYEGFELGSANFLLSIDD